ncbi:MAG TPA: mercuric reductase [Myxococcales bacterium]|nr:mercuric reductase [Myxococcales bacterium]
MEFDVIIVGTGQAGVPLATRLAGAGKRVLIAERGELGGTCVNSGCTPTKTMIASARAAHVARTTARLGIRVGAVEVDLPAIVDRKDAVVRRWREGVRKRLQSAGDRLTLVHGDARFVEERRIQIGAETYEANTVVLDVGARPATPRIEGLDRVPWLTYETVMQLREVPAHLLVLGGSYAGCEFGQMFRRFGARVTIVEPSPHLMNREDAEISSALEGVFRDEGIGLELGAEAENVSRSEGHLIVGLRGGKELRGSHLLVVTGRQPNTEDLGCAAAGIQLDEKGFIVADDQYRTSAPGTYAVGDVIGEPQFTHVAWDDHRLLFDILLGRAHRSRKERHIPYTAFTDPQLAGVGLTEREARERGIAYEVATKPFAEVARAVEIDETAGILKVLVDPKTERILGAAIVGADAGELIHVFVVLMQAGAPARAIVEAEAVHPTFAEGLQSVVMKLPRYSL